MVRLNQLVRVGTSKDCKRIVARDCRGRPCQIYHRVTPFLSWPLPIWGIE
jgi:hypothetical protein